MSNDTPDSPGTPERPQTDALPRAPQLDLTKLAASVAGAVLSAIVLSKFGVAGTISGAALGSLIASVGTEVNQHYLHRSSRRLRELHAAKFRAAIPQEARRGWGLPGWLSWKALAAVGAAGFLVAMLVITGFELAVGKPLADVVGNQQAAEGRSTTVGQVTGGGGADEGSQTPTPSVDSDTTTPTTTPGGVVSTTSTLPSSTTLQGVAPSTVPGATGGGRQQAPTTAPAAPGG